MTFNPKVATHEQPICIQHFLFLTGREDDDRCGPNLCGVLASVPRVLHSDVILP